MTLMRPLNFSLQAHTASAKWSFATRRVTQSDVVMLDHNLTATRAGDLILAEVTRIGSHKRLQMTDGRFSPLWPGDRIVVACADRYAVDQFDGRARLSPDGADLLAGGGIAGQIVSKHDKMSRATRLAVLGRLADATGTPLSTEHYAMPPSTSGRPHFVVAVLGTGMNAGKTSAAAGLINGFTRLGRQVGAVKVTGTGSFGDVHEYEAAGAARVLDFTDEPIVSSDAIGSPASCIFDSQATMVTGSMVKTIGWYEQGGGLASRIVDVIEQLGPRR